MAYPEGRAAQHWAHGTLGGRWQHPRAGVSSLNAVTGRKLVWFGGWAGELVMQITCRGAIRCLQDSVHSLDGLTPGGQQVFPGLLSLLRLEAYRRPLRIVVPYVLTYLNSAARRKTHALLQPGNTSIQVISKPPSSLPFLGGSPSACHWADHSSVTLCVALPPKEIKERQALQQEMWGSQEMYRKMTWWIYQGPVSWLQLCGSSVAGSMAGRRRLWSGCDQAVIIFFFQTTSNNPFPHPDLPRSSRLHQTTPTPPTHAL